MHILFLKKPSIFNGKVYLHTLFSTTSMKKTLLFLLFTATLLAGTTTATAQMPVTTPRMYGSSPFQDSLWGIDTTNFSIFTRMGPTLAGFTITGMNGMAYDPTTYETYIIMKVSGVTGRVLGKIDLTTGVCTQIGNLGQNFSSITFREDGQLLGATGNGSTTSEGLFLIDKNTAATTLLYVMGNGADGEVLLYNRADDFIYHWSGNSTMVYEKMAASNVTYTPINIVPIGISSGETFGAIYLDSSKILISNISSQIRRLGTDGTYGAGSIASLPDDFRGLVMPPQFLASDDSVCQGETVYVGAGSLQLFDTVVYHWGDGTFDVVGLTGGTHVYSTPGDYTINIELDNGVVRDTTLYTFSVHVDSTPVVLLAGNTNICSGDSVTLTGVASGVTNQWYMNGIAIPGATLDTYSTNVAGVYNMSKTNLAGCVDSSSVGLILVDVINPTVNLGADTTVCNSITLDAQNASATYVWSTSGSLQTETITTSGTYDVMVMDTNSCMSSDTITLVVNPNPVFTLGADAEECVSLVLSTGIGGTSLWSDNSTGSTLTVTTSGQYDVTVTDGNGCFSSDTVAVIINNLPTVSLVGSATLPCVYDGAVTLTGTPAGGSFSGTSVSGNQFDPAIGVGSHDVYYSFTDANGCSAEDTLTIVVDACASIDENNTFLLTVYPNPTTGLIHVEIPVDGAAIQVTDVFGKVVYSNNSVSSKSTINLTGNAIGAYFVSVTTQDGEHSIARIVLTK